MKLTVRMKLRSKLLLLLKFRPAQLMRDDRLLTGSGRFHPKELGIEVTDRIEVEFDWDQHFNLFGKPVIWNFPTN